MPAKDTPTGTLVRARWRVWNAVDEEFEFEDASDDDGGDGSDGGDTDRSESDNEMDCRQCSD